MYPEDEEIAGHAYLMAQDSDRGEPKSYKEAIEGPDGEKWIDASDDEMRSLKKNETWTLVDRVMDHRPIGCKWIYKKKE